MAVPDSEGASLMARASCALVGADSVLRDGAVVNKVGTHSLARAAVDRKKPFYVACETLKFDARYDAATWPGLRIATMSSTFEVTPPELITTTVTERGTYTPEIVRTMLSPGRDGRRPGAAES
jgi:translation initiation factor 2B subunit (eIF-2B alpha/beta/delta family)